VKVQRRLFWGNVNRIEDIKLVKKIIYWNPIGVRTERPPKNRWRDEVMNNRKKTITVKLDLNPQRQKSLEWSGAETKTHVEL